MRRPVPFRVRIALGAFAGLALAWLIPKGGTVPAPDTTSTPSDRPGITAVQIPLDSVPDGVSFRTAGGLRVFLVREASAVTGYLGRSTAPGDGPLWWCQRNESFENEGGTVRYGIDGRAVTSTAPRNLDVVRVLVTADEVTIFPQNVTLGEKAAATGSTERLKAPCPASERVG